MVQEQSLFLSLAPSPSPYLRYHGYPGALAILVLGLLGTLPSVPASGACAAYRRARDHESRRPLRIRQSLKKSEMNNLVEGISEWSENDCNTTKTIWSGYWGAYLRKGTY